MPTGALPLMISPTAGAMPGLPKFGTDQMQNPEALDLTEEFESRPQFDSLFGVMNQGQNAEQQLAQKENAQSTPEQEQSPSETGSAVQDKNAPKPGELARGGAAGTKRKPSRRQPAMPMNPAARKPPKKRRAPSSDFAASPAIKPDQGQAKEDVYTNVLKKLAKPRTMMLEKPLAQEPSMPAPAVTGDRGDLESLDMARISAGAEPGPPVVAVPADKHVVLDHLGGSNDDVFNQQLRQGDKNLHAGQFYQAATRYESGAMLRRDNPLPLMGAGIAYLGAGESYKASIIMQKGLHAFPAMMHVRLDLDAFMGKPVVDQRLAELEDRLKDAKLSDNVPLVFLVTYIHASRNDVAARTEWAAKLMSVVSSDSVLSAYARQFLTNGQVDSSKTGTASRPSMDSAQARGGEVNKSSSRTTKLLSCHDHARPRNSDGSEVLESRRSDDHGPVQCLLRCCYANCSPSGRRRR